ncbi:nuclear telomere cap complex subunit, Ten1 superfamily [Histoplasma capsulatum]|uniref:Nuclear telomere cap complex subunit, Ten1 superfamily n=1 Tax=Ajellomyces capsulatus TaxID=5037 RepID=A0A8A1MCB2_AJECA|nr:predicted protein [Histoplasma mississippiense (nom. inval.)]EDN08993.1 predicted protein [Histoplasma mississippiense (nom. inval.)]QSS63591.1 nuclear telomere cap complex subunit, Ten1 superfamily [Histoplasma capsulatum]
MSKGPAGPLPTTRAFLSEIPNLPTGSKIRFLGCVSSYNVSTGHLLLEHNYPITKRPIPSIAVDISLLLEQLKATDLQVGAWLNVLGYIREQPSTKSLLSPADPKWPPPAGADRNSSSPPSPPLLPSPSGAARSVFVEAVMVFSADAVRLGEYERVLQEWEDADRRVKRPAYESRGTRV